VIGFALGWEGQAHRVLWITGDTVLYDGVRQVADRLQVDTAPAPPRLRTLPGHRADPLHHDRPRGRRAVPAGPPPHRHPGPLRGLDPLPPRPTRHRG
jgi:hypothetical protein